MDTPERRSLITAAVAGGVGLLAAGTADAQNQANQPHAPEPKRNDVGSNILGPRNMPLERQNPDLLAPPRTDHGSLPNMKWSFADRHMRLEQGGWARETTIRELSVSKQMAGVNMRLDAGAGQARHGRHLRG